MDQNKQSASPSGYQWNTSHSVPQSYPIPISPASDEPQKQNGSMVPVHAASTSPTSLHTTYGNSNNQYSTYYNTSQSSPNYPPSTSGNNQQLEMYPNGIYAQAYHHSQAHSQAVPPPQSSVPQTTYQPYINPYSHSLSNPQTQGYGVPSGEKDPYTIPKIPQTIGISSESPTSPGKPYSCDLCALSFNRQHDLKRHRETHTGEKPYLCNGGCGKTFTRKDALKRHKLVKNCGQVDSTWS